jgi:hypothetical protein
MSRALYHLSYGTREREGYREVGADRSFSLRFFRRCFAIATRFLLFIPRRLELYSSPKEGSKRGPAA